MKAAARWVASTVVLVTAMIAAVDRRGAAADRLTGTRGRVIERDHIVTATLDRGHATLVVRRTVRNLDPRHDQAVLWLEVPSSSVATGLRTLGVSAGKPTWFAGDLMEAETAARKYRELTGLGGYYPKDPALLSWRSREELALQVFPVAPFSDKTVEYTLVVPTTYSGGREHLDLGRLGTPTFAPTMVVRAARPGDRLFVEGRPYPSGASASWQVLGGAEVAASPEPLETTAAVIGRRDLFGLDDEDADDDDSSAADDAEGLGALDGPAAGHAGAERIDLSLGWPGAPLLGGRLAEAEVTPGRVLVRYRIEAAPRLGKVPPRAGIVVLLDASRSLTDDQRAAELAAARGYLSHFEDARVQLVTFARRPALVEPRPVSAARAIDDLAAGILVPENGSAVDLALRAADRLLSRQPPGPRRVVLLTDLRTREALAPESVRDALAASGALLHVGVVEHGAPALTVDDDSPWASMARRTGGLVWSATAHRGAAWQPRAHAVFEEWARPMRVRRFNVDGAGLANAPPEASPVSSAGRRGVGGIDDPVETDELREGESASALWIHGRRMPELIVSGELWARPVRAVLRRDVVETRLWSALVFGSPVSDQLSEPEMMILARAGRAVSPVTSYLAIEPGVRPSTEGLTEGEVTVGGSGGIGHGSLACHGSRARSSFDHVAFLREALAEVWRRCGGGQARAAVTIEATLAEIVDVRDATVGAGEGSARCLTEGAWHIELSDAFDAEHGHWHVAL